MINIQSNCYSCNIFNTIVLVVYIEPICYSCNNPFFNPFVFIMTPCFFLFLVPYLVSAQPSKPDNLFAKTLSLQPTTTSPPTFAATDGAGRVVPQIFKQAGGKDRAAVRRIDPHKNARISYSFEDGSRDVSSDTVSSVDTYSSKLPDSDEGSDESSDGSLATDRPQPVPQPLPSTSLFRNSTVASRSRLVPWTYTFDTATPSPTLDDTRPR